MVEPLFEELVFHPLAQEPDDYVNHGIVVGGCERGLTVRTLRGLYLERLQQILYRNDKLLHEGIVDFLVREIGIFFGQRLTREPDNS